MFQGIVRSNGGETISRDRKRMAFAQPQAVEAVAMLRDLNDSGALENLDVNTAMETLGIRFTAIGDDWLQGTMPVDHRTHQPFGLLHGGASVLLAETLGSSAAMLAGGAKDKYELRASTMPRFGDKPVRPNNSGSALVIFSGDPMRQRAAWELMKFLTSKRGYTIITSEIGYLPLRTDIVNDPAYLGEWVKAHPLVQPNLEQLKVLEPWEPMPGSNYRQIVKTMMDAAEQAVTGKGDVGATLLAAQQTTQAMLPQ